MASADNFNTTRAKLTLYKGYSAYLSQNLDKLIEESDSNDTTKLYTAQDIANRLELGAAFWETIAPYIGEIDDPEFLAIVADF